MKKLSLLLMVTLMLLLPFTQLTVSASTWRITENAPISVPRSSPVIDGSISASEGWSAVSYLNEQTAGYFWQQNPLTGSCDIYFAYDDDGLYFACDYSDTGAAYTVKFYDGDGNMTHEAVYADADAESYKCEPGGYPAKTPDGFNIESYKIDQFTTSAEENVIPATCFWNTFTGNSFVYSTGYDDIDIDPVTGENLYGFNGDVIALMIDTANKFVGSGRYADDDYTAWYCVGLFEDEGIKVYRTRVNGGDITDSVKASGKSTDDGMTFEIMIPWDIIVKDANDMAAGAFTVSKEDVISAAENRAAVMLHDRFIDPDIDVPDTWGRYITVNAASPEDGEPGNLSEGECLDAYGLKLSFASAGGSAPATTTAAATSSTTAAAKTAQTVSPSGSGGTGASAQTFDAGIAVFAGSAVCAALAAVYTRKKRR